MESTQVWWLALGMSAVVVVVVAALLGWVIAAAREVDEHARSIWTTGKQIAANTTGIWMLEQTNAHLREVRRSASALEAALASIGEMVGPGGRRGR